MAEPDQLKKETVRIELPHPDTVNPQDPTLEPHETVRRTLNPEPLGSSPKKAQSLIAVPQVAPKNPVSSITRSDKTWMLLYWLLLGLSAFILIIQIWTYFS